MKRILFLDDCPARQKWAKENFDIPGNYFAYASTAAEAIEWIGWGEPEGFFDDVYLGHDLGGEVYVDSLRNDCGMEVVRWIVENKPKLGRIVVHTMNVIAGIAMCRSLKLAGYDAARQPFNQLTRELHSD